MMSPPPTPSAPTARVHVGADRAAGRRTALAAWGGAVTMFLAHPPADLWLGGWLAPLPWLMLVRADTLGGRRPWTTLWLAGIGHWLATIHWLRLPHPATSIGWVALSCYLGLYLPLFVGVARRLVHGHRWPLVPATAVAWVAAEQLRGWLLGGFTFGGLGHTQWRWTTLIQCADALGAVGVSGVVMAGAAGIAALMPAPPEAESARRSPGGRGRDVGIALMVVISALAYGVWRLGQPVADTPRPLEVLLVQGSIDTELKQDPDAAVDVARHYDELTMEGLAAGPVDLVAWPETMWRWGLLEIDPDEVIAASVVDRMLGPATDGDTQAVRQARCRQALADERLDALAVFARRYATPWIVGIDKQVVTPRAGSGFRSYNCALFLDAAGTPLACYEKMHPVMFGEYVPLADRFPALQRLTPLPTGLTAGTHPVAVDIAGWEVATNICYETALPEAVRALVRSLAAANRRPDVIVNLTNDGWFWGSSELDMHLTAAIFRAVEVRTPLVIAANTGFSASIDGSGRLLARGPRRATAALRVTVTRDGRWSPWLTTGSLPGWLCVAVAAAVLLGPIVRPTHGRDRGDTRSPP
jgi:apolipoprotein N-acyltransferase